MTLLAPPHIGFIPSIVTQVDIWEGDSLEWLWYHHAMGSYIYGYIITR